MAPPWADSFPYCASSPGCGSRHVGLRTTGHLQLLLQPHERLHFTRPGGFTPPGSPARQGTVNAYVDWAELRRRTSDVDVFACVRCGGRLEGLGVREGGPSGCGRFWSTWACPRPVRGWPRHRGPPQPRGVEAQDSQQAQAPATHLMGARPGKACTPRGFKRAVHRPGASLGRPRQRPSSAPPLQPSPSTGPLSRLYVRNPPQA